MTGCLTAPFKLVGCLVLVGALVLAWLYRDVVLEEGRRLLERGGTVAAAEATGRPGILALKAAQLKVASLDAARADSVLLTPAEVASLVGVGLPSRLRARLDSLQVRLEDGAIGVHARLRTDQLPRDALGPLAGALRGMEPVEAVGPLRITGPGQGEWEIRSFRVRDLPLPADLVPVLLGRVLGRERAESVPVRVPRGVASVRIRPAGATLYGAARE